MNITTKSQMGQEIGGKSPWPDLASAIVRRALMVLSSFGGVLPFKEPKHDRLLASMILWLVRAEGVKLEEFGTKLLGDPQAKGVELEDAQDCVLLRLMISTRSASGLAWEHEFLLHLEEVAWLLAPDAAFSVEFNVGEGEHFLVFQSPVPESTRICLSLDEVAQLKAQKALARLADEALSRATGVLPKIRLLPITDHTVSAWQSFIPKESDK